MNLIEKARRLESRIARTVDLAVTGVVGPSARQPLEIIDAIVDWTVEQVQPGPRGRRLFPYNEVVAHLLARTVEERARFEAIAAGPPSLLQRIRERLASAGCEIGDLHLRVAYAPRAKAGWRTPECHVSFHRAAAVRTPPSAPARPTAAPRLELAVVHGTAERRSYSFAGSRVELGRGAEVLDGRQRLIRRNHVAFSEDGTEVNRSVSRRHAHVVFDVDTQQYRLRDDGSARGTAVVRGGRTIRVPQGSRGARLESGDEIVLGDARLRVKIGA